MSSEEEKTRKLGAKKIVFYSVFLHTEMIYFAFSLETPANGVFYFYSKMSKKADYFL